MSLSFVHHEVTESKMGRTQRSCEEVQPTSELCVCTLGGVFALAASFSDWQTDEALDWLRDVLPTTPESFAEACQQPQRSFARCVGQRLKFQNSHKNGLDALTRVADILEVGKKFSEHCGQPRGW